MKKLFFIFILFGTLFGVNTFAQTVTNGSQIIKGSSSVQGPDPVLDIKAYMPGQCSEANGGSGTNYPLTVSVNGTTTVTITSSGGYITAYNNGCGVLIQKAGPNSVVSAPTSVTATSHVTGGSTTIKYQVVCIDNNEGVSPASTVYSFTTSDLYTNLTTRHYNFISWSGSSNCILYAVYSDLGAGGALTCIGESPVAAYKDRGYTTPCATFLPTNPPNSNQPQALFTTIVSGGTTSTWVVANAATQTNTGLNAMHDISTFLSSALTTSESVVGGSYVGTGATFLIPAGVYTLAHNPFQGYGANFKILGTLWTADMPITLQGGTLDGSESDGPCGNFSAYDCAYVDMSASTAVGVDIVNGGVNIKNISFSNGGSGSDGVNVYIQGGGSISLIQSFFIEAPSYNDCPVQVDSNVIYAKVFDDVFTAGTGSLAGGSMCFTMQIAANSSSGFTFRDNYFIERGIWLDNPGPGTQSVLIGTAFEGQNNTENNYDNGILNVDVGISGQYGQLGPTYFAKGGQDNTHNASINFATLYCYTAAQPGGTCGEILDDQTANASVIRTSTPGTSLLEAGGYTHRISSGLYGSSGWYVAHNPGGGQLVQSPQAELLPADVAMLGPGGVIRYWICGNATCPLYFHNYS